MQTKKNLKLVMAALLAAMTCVATLVIKIPITATNFRGLCRMPYDCRILPYLGTPSRIFRRKA